MIIFPAVDIQRGHAVRLRQGRKHEATIYADNPLDLAAQWRDAGATWLHIVDLDGAFEGGMANAQLVEAICRRLGLSVQVGGGIRDADSARAYLDAGATRLIIGTMALAEPEKFKKLCAEFPGKIGVSLDARDGRLKTHGWVKDAGANVVDIAPRMADDGAAFIIYTDITRDGMGDGLNIPALEAVLEATSLPVIAAGGVSSMKDIEAAWNIRDRGNLQGVISGRAICEGDLDLALAVRWLAAHDEKSAPNPDR